MLINWSAWLGTVCMAFAPFVIDTDQGKLMAMAGLTLLCLQAYDKKCYNLIILNITGIIGYFYALYF
jgi:hypothetical protein